MLNLRKHTLRDDALANYSILLQPSFGAWCYGRFHVEQSIRRRRRFVIKIVRSLSEKYCVTERSTLFYFILQINLVNHSARHVP